LSSEYPYFEITIDLLADEGCIAVGLADRSHNLNLMPGLSQNSFGYHRNGETFHNADKQSYCLPKFGLNDTVGCGLLIDDYNSTYVFFTLNGKFLGTSFVSVVRGMDCYPTVGITKSCSIRINFTPESFKWNPNSIKLFPDRNRRDIISTIPNELLLRIILEASISPIFNMLSISMVSKTFKVLSEHEQVWRQLYLMVFPRQSRNLKVKDWKRFYKQRKQALDKAKPKEVHPIENCQMEFSCPLIWDNLKRTSNINRRSCSVCNSDVYIVTSQEELEKNIHLGRCVAFEPHETTKEWEIRGMGRVSPVEVDVYTCREDTYDW